MPHPPIIRPSSKRPRRTGAAAVEFAIVAPIFFLMVIGIIEFGRMVMTQQVIINAAREGARIAVLDSATTPKVKDRVNDYLKSAGIGGSIVTVAPDPPTTAKFGEQVSVEVRVPFSAISKLSQTFLKSNRELIAESVMRRETAD